MRRPRTLRQWVLSLGVAVIVCAAIFGIIGTPDGEASDSMHHFLMAVILFAAACGFAALVLFVLCSQILSQAKRRL